MLMCLLGLKLKEKHKLVPLKFPKYEKYKTLTSCFLVDKSVYVNLGLCNTLRC